MKSAYLYETKLGKVLIAEDGIGITEVSLLSDPEDMGDIDLWSGNAMKYELCETEMITEAAKQLCEYMEGNRKKFTVKLNPQGTLFQMKVWEALLAIPYGETRSYKQIAEAIGNEKASRAVGMANHNNPIICMIPCHRVIGANGALVGYAAGLSTKEKLLSMETERK